MLEEVGRGGVLDHGRAYLKYWTGRMTFSIEALNEVDLLRRGAVALCEAVAARPPGDEEDRGKDVRWARDYYDRAIRAGEAAVVAAASEVLDPSDRGGIVAYYHLLVREVNRFVDEYVEELLTRC